MTTADLPTLNAALNLTSAALLASGWMLIRARRERAHRACMVSAFGVSIVFLTSYVIYHASEGSTPYGGTGLLRGIYFAILVPHVLLAMAVPPLAIVTVWRAVRDDRAGHRRIARVTFPIWMFVSVTGVIVYWMLRPWYGAGA